MNNKHDTQLTLLTAIVLASLILYAFPAAVSGQNPGGAQDSTTAFNNAISSSQTAYTTLFMHLSGLSIDSAKFTHFTNSGYVMSLEGYGPYITVNDNLMAKPQNSAVTSSKQQNLIFGGSCTDTGFADAFAFGTSAPATPVALDTEYYVDQNQQSIAINNIWTNSNCSPFTANIYLVPGGSCESFTPSPSNILESASNIAGLAPANSYLFTTAVNSLSIRFYGVCSSAEDSDNVFAGATSIKSGIQISATLVAGAPTASNSIISGAQDSVITAAPSGGTTIEGIAIHVPYSINWYASAGTTAPTCTPANQISVGYAYNGFTVYPSATTTYAYQVTDKATVPVSVCSSGATVAVSSIPPPTSPVVPANIVYYIPITMTNYQPAAVASNTPLIVGVTSQVASNVIGFPVNSYSQYFTANLVNYEFFDAGGNVLPSYMEGNYVNEVTWNGLANSKLSTNAPVNSGNVIFWVTSPYWNDYLSSSAGRTPTTDTIYLGWAGNYIGNAGAIAANFLMGSKNANGNMIIGEAPQLSCPVASSTATCATYAAFDNGNYIFGLGGGFEANFTGSSYTQLPSWISYATSNTQETTGNYLLVSNSITMSIKSCPNPNCNAIVYSTIPFGPTGTQMTTEILETADSGAAPNLGEANQSSFNPSPYIDTANYITDSASLTYTVTISTAAPNELIYMPVTVGDGQASTTTASDSAGLTWLSRGVSSEGTAGSSNSMYAFAPTVLNNDVITVTLPVSGAEPSTAFAIAIANVNAITPFDPNSLLPTTGSATTSVNSETSGTFSTRNANDMLLYAIGFHGSAGTLTAGLIGGVQSALVSGSVGGASETAVEYANVITMQTGITAAMSWSTASKLDYFADAVEGAVSSTTTLTPAVGAGNYLLIPSYAAEWTSNNWRIGSSTNGAFNDINQFGSAYAPADPAVIGITWSNSANLYPVSGSTANDLLIVNGYSNSTVWGDSAISRQGPMFAFWSGSGGLTGTKTDKIQWFRVRLTPPNAILPSTVYGNAMNVPSVTLSSCPTNTIVDTGQYQSCTATITDYANTQPYTYNFLISNAVSPFKIANTNTIVYSGISSHTQTATWSVGSNQLLNSPVQVNAMITDSGSPVRMANSVYSANYLVFSTPATPILTGTNSPNLDSNQYILFSAYEPGGATPLTYNFLVYNSITDVLIANDLVVGTNTFLFPVNGLVGNTINANVIITDSASVSETVNSVLTSSWTINTVPSIPTLAVSNTPNIDTNQYELFSAYESGGTLPYTYNFLVYNSITNVLVANMLTTSNTFLWQVTGNSGNTINANVFVADGSGTPNIQNSISTGTIAVNSVLTAMLLHPTNTHSYDAGRGILIDLLASGGSPPYTTYNFLVYNSITNTIVANSLQTSNSFVFVVPSSLVGNTIYSNVIINDSASSPRTANTLLSAVLTINSAQSTPTILPSTSQSYDAGQTVTWQSYESGGTAPYTYNFIVYNSVTNIQIANMLTASNSFAYLIPAGESGNTLNANVFVQDSSTNGIISNSILSGAITVEPGLQTPTISASNTPNIDTNQYEFFSAYESGGTAPYTYNFIVYNSVTNIQVANMLTTSNTFLWQVTGNSGNTLNANIFVTDSASSGPALVNSILTSTITVNPTPTITLSPDTNTVTTLSSVVFTNTVMGGTAPYSYSYSIFQYGAAAQPGNYVISSNSIEFINTAATAQTFNVLESITDHTGVTAYSANSVVTVNPSLSIALSPTTSAVTAGSSVSFTNTTTGGTAPYTYSYSIFQYGSAAQSGNYVISGNSIEFVNGAGTAQTFNVIESVTDHSGALAYSSNSVITVNPGISIVLSPATNTITTSSSVKFTNTTTGGTAPYSYSYSIFQYGAAAQPGNYVISGNSIEFINTAATAQTFNVVESVTDHTGATAYSANSVVTVNPALSITVSPSTATIDTGQSVIFTNVTAGGTTPFAYSYSIFQYGTAAQSGNYVLSDNSIEFINTAATAQTFNVVESVTDHSDALAYSSNSVITVNPSLSISITPATATIDQSQSVTFSNTVTGGTTPFSYAYVVNSLSGVTISGNTITFANAGTFNVLETVTDGQGVTAYSANSVITVNPSLSISITPATATIDQGQSVTFSNTVTGGTSPFSYAYTVNSLSGVTISGNTITFANAGTFNVLESVIDNEGVTAYSSNSVIKVNPSLSITVLPSTATVGTGQPVIFTNTVIGGTAPYAYAYSVFQYGTAAQPGNYIISGNSIEFVNNAATAQTFNVIESVTDHSGTVAYSSNSVITVNPAVSITITPSTATIDTGQSVIFSNTVTGGTSPFSYAYSIFQYGTAAQPGNYVISGNSIQFLDTAGTAQTFNVIESVTDHSGAVAYSSNSVVTANPSLSVAISPSTATINAGQSVTFSNTVTGGTAPFSYAYTVNSLSGVTINGNTITFANADTFNVLESVTDSVGVTASSSNSTITVNSVSGLTVSILPTSATINAGQPVAFTNTTSGGTSPYAYSYSVFQYGVLAQLSNYSVTGNSITFINAGTYNILETVTDTFGSTASSSNSIITVNPVSSNVLVNESVTINANGGTSASLSTFGSIVVNSNSLSNVNANILVTLVTANYSSTPTETNYTFNKEVILNATISSESSASLSKYIVLSCTTYGGCDGLMPYILNDLVWYPIQTYQVNDTAETINVTIPGDPVVALFRATPTSTSTTTISSGGGGGGTAIHGSGGTGVPPPQPIVSKANNSYTVSDLAQENKITLSLNNTKLNITGGTVNLNSSTIYISGVKYVLYPNSSVAINGSLLYVKLVNTSYPKLGRRSISLFVGVAGQPSATQLFGLNYLPSFTSINNNQGANLQLNVKNIWNTQEQINFNAPKAFPGAITFSANNVTLAPGKSITINLQFVPDPNVAAGLYYVPITITSTAAGGVNTKETQFLAFKIKNTTSNAPYTSTQITLINNSQTASGVIQVYGYSNQSLSNTTLRTVLPLSIVGNVSNIQTYGMQNNITVVNGSYVINWNVNYIPKGTSAYAYFTLQNPTSTPSLVFIQNKLVPFSPSQLRNSSDVSVISIYLPTFYSNYTSAINVHAIYRNMTPGQVAFSLTGPPGVTIGNSTQVVNATLNQTMNRTFDVDTGSITGTVILGLHIRSNGTNFNENLPIFVIAKPQYTIAVPNNVTQIPQSTERDIEIGILIVVLAAAIGYIILQLMERGRIKKETASIKEIKSEMIGAKKEEKPAAKKGKKD